ncbi:conjugal transfer protein TraV [Novosphingobium sp.]|uniref:conjugal transfer protein TraV n=1 Tax=Novosphingobium sp. TaxID=1874826 RepID=UPI00333EB2B2
MHTSLRHCLRTPSHSAIGFLAAAPLVLALSGCVSLGTNVKGQFMCRAPKGDCAPSRVIDERAAQDIGSGHEPSDLGRARVRAGIAPPIGAGSPQGSPQRTGERTLRIVFPAHVDETGTLRDEAVAWAVVEAPQWSAQLGVRTAPPPATPIARQIGRQLKAAREAHTSLATTDPVPAASPSDADSATPPDSTDPFKFASPPALPSTVGETKTGAPPPVAEGSDMAATPHDRIPRSFVPELAYPAAAAIDAARRRAGAPADRDDAPGNSTASPSVTTPLPKEPRP